MNMYTDLLQVENIHKSHDSLPTLKGVDLAIRQSEILCLLGPSGCGKTTLLRIIAGLEKADQGRVRFDNIDLGSIPPFRRKFTMMFQEFALFPHKNVFENIAFGLRMQKLGDDAIKSRAKTMIELVGLQGMETRDINDLSGGERQRVALARSLAPNPRLLMLDEPMGSLDRALRERLVLDVRQILKKVGVTTLFVTHDQNEAFVLADRIAVFNQGFIEQIGTPEELFKNPVNEFVARFLGFQNLVPISKHSNGIIDTPIGSFKPGQPVKGKSLLLVRPESIRIPNAQQQVVDGELELKCKVVDCRFQGASYQVQVAVNDKVSLVFPIPSEAEPPPSGEEFSLALNVDAMNVL
ncbi:MAG: ABC transporter ATP-binding protein [Proteobacteria bacterium]|nr:ABC transporter ATP-binding protein [Pseudomonadota bacterium]